MNQVKNLINGEWYSSETHKPVINPATGDTLAQCHFANPEMVDAAVSAARQAFSSWAAQTDQNRKKVIEQVAQLIESNMPELAQLVVQESGKPINGLNGVGANMEVGGAMVWAQATAALDLPVDVLQDDETGKIEVHRKPLGVVASITPWNWPLMIAVWHILPALRAGNTVVLKPSPFTPVATTKLVELMNTILPKGVLNIVHGDTQVGAALTSHNDVNKVIFTGSTATGKHIMRSAADNLKRLTLELGGNDAAIVLPNQDVEALAPALFGAAFHNNGQTCACIKRLYVHTEQYQQMCQALADYAQNVVVGDGLDEQTQLGPLQNAQQREVVQTLLDDAKRNNARILCGGESLGDKGYFFAPTIVADQSNGNRIVDEEQFGPILPVIKYENVEQAVTMANQNQAGLGGSVWSSDVAQATKIAQQLETGTAWVNEHGALHPNAPFGGVKQSGVGVEFGRYGLEEYTSIQTVKVAL